MTATLVASVTNQQVAINLGGDPQVPNSFGNGYNYYGAVATATTGWTFFQRGTVSGPWDWLDSYINQIWFNAQLQQAALSFMTQIKSMPYTSAGYALLESALADPIQAADNFGVYRAGVTLSAAQAAEVNNAAGVDIVSMLETQGYYLQIKDAAPSVRQSRGSPPISLWYTDGESIQALQIASINVQ